MKIQIEEADLRSVLDALEYLRKPIAQGWEAETQQEKSDLAITICKQALEKSND